MVSQQVAFDTPIINYFVALNKNTSFSCFHISWRKIRYFLLDTEIKLARVHPTAVLLKAVSTFFNFLLARQLT